MTTIDLNADLGESFGAYQIGNDRDLLKIVSSANIACGFHGGDPSVMHGTIQAAKAAGVRMGAHPGFNDLAGFGRRVIRGNSPAEIGHMILYQIGAFQGIARALDAEMAYVKLHGALSNMAMVEQPIADAFLSVMQAGAPGVAVMAMPHSAIESGARDRGVSVIKEAFADRAYLANGMLMPRSQPNAVIHDPGAACARVLDMLDSRSILADDGSRIPADIDSICVHGDNPEAVAIAQSIRNALESAGVSVAPVHGS